MLNRKNTKKMETGIAKKIAKHVDELQEKPYIKECTLHAKINENVIIYEYNTNKLIIFHEKGIFKTDEIIWRVFSEEEIIEAIDIMF